MAKKFVRGVTGIEDIESYDKTLTNVNDILSDGQNTYVHTKKGKNESYYNLTDNVKKVEASGETINVVKDENGTVNLSTNPQKVLEHDNLTGNTNYVKIEHSSGKNTTLINSNQISQKFETVDSSLLSKQDKLMAGAGVELKNNIISVLHVPQSVVDLNNIITTQYLKVETGSTNLPQGSGPYGILSVVRIGDVAIQTYQTHNNNGLYIRTAFRIGLNTIWTAWQKIVTQSVS